MKSHFIIFLSILNIFYLAAQDKCTGWQPVGTSEQHAYIFINICEYSSGGSGYIKFKNTSDIPTRVSYTINFKNGKETTGSTPIGANSTTSGSSCFSCAEKNAGVQSWSVEIQSSERSSKSSSSSDNTASTNDDWSKNEPLISSQNNYSTSNSSNSSRSQESIYQKRQREAQERKEREIEYNRNIQRQANQIVEQGQKKIAVAQKAMDNWNNMFDNIENAKRMEYEREQREFERKRQLREERERRERLAAERRRQEELEKRRREEAIRNAKQSFMKSIQNLKWPLFYNQDKAYVLLVSKVNNDKVTLVPVLVYKNSDNQLPYKPDILNAVWKERKLGNLHVHGIFESFDGLKQSANTLFSKGQKSYVTVTESKRFEYGKPQSITSPQKPNTDFWGNKKNSTKTKSKKTKKDDFWNN